jgi:uncharacterized protein YigA (DUF484 family)
MDAAIRDYVSLQEHYIDLAREAKTQLREYQKAKKDMAALYDDAQTGSVGAAGFMAEAYDLNDAVMNSKRQWERLRAEKDVVNRTLASIEARSSSDILGHDSYPEIRRNRMVMGRESIMAGWAVRSHPYRSQFKRDADGRVRFYRA